MAMTSTPASLRISSSGMQQGILICATFEPLCSGEQARQLVADTARAVQLIGR
jgi:hypothetical protein